MVRSALRLRSFVSLSLLASTLLIAPPAHSALFQNNNTSCQDEPLLDINTGNTYLPAHSVICGNFTDDTPSGNRDFPDCAVVVDPTNVSDTTAGDLNKPADLAILYNSGNHTGPAGQSAITGCFNATPAGFKQLKSPTVFDISPEFSNPSSNRVGSLISANFKPTNSPFDDLAVVDVSDSSLLVLPSDFTGGFGNAGNVGGLLTPTPSINDTQLNLFMSGQTVQAMEILPSSSNSSDRSAVAVDCDGVNGTDAVVGVFVNHQASLQILKNNGTNLTPPLNPGDSIALGVLSGGSVERISLTSGSFGGVGGAGTDLAIAIDTDASDSDSLVICRNTGSCSYGCLPPTDLSSFAGVPTGDAAPTSIVAGNFNGDLTNRLDLAINLRDAGEVLYLFGDGTGAFPTSQIVSVIDTVHGASTASVHTLTTGQFNSDTITDVAVATNQQVGPVRLAEIAVIPSNPSGGFFNPEYLTFAPAGSTLASGIATADFDRCGGDDLIAVSENGSTPTRNVSVFLSQNEPPVANVTAIPATMGRNTTLVLTASCSDPSNDQVSYTWVQTGPQILTLANSSATLGASPLDASTTITLDANTTPGTYTFNLSCTDFCGASAVSSSTSNLEVSLAVTNAICGNGIIESPEECDEGSDNGSTTSVCRSNCTFTNSALSDQGGGCSLSSTETPNHFKYSFFLMGGILISILLIARSKGFTMRSFGKLSLLILLTFWSASSSAASFDVTGFRPTVDSSDYFSIYSSRTMPKRGWHAGFWLNWANEPYEFGNGTTRVRGIVDDTIVGDFVGSYAFTDKITVGVDLPAVFYEDFVNQTTLNHETKGGIGDLGVLGKIQLINPEEKRFGLAAIPFITFPTSNLSSEFAGNGNITGGAKLALDAKLHERVDVGLNVGFRFREPTRSLGGQKISHQMTMGLGTNVKIVDKLDFIGEVDSSTVMTDFFHKRTTPVELRGGLRYEIQEGLQANVGAGMGVNNGISDPQVRVLAGITYTHKPGFVEEKVEETPVPSGPKAGEELKLADKVYFELNKSEIRDISRPTLDKAAAYLRKHPQITKLRIEGHTCDLASDQYNQALSERRAQSVVDYLVGQGVEPSRLHAMGYGEKYPAVPNTDEPHREQNRRVQFFIEEVR